MRYFSKDRAKMKAIESRLLLRVTDLIYIYDLIALEVIVCAYLSNNLHLYSHVYNDIYIILKIF